MKPVKQFDEDRYISEIVEYLDSTYQGHYVGKNNLQAIDLIFANDHGISFCIGNALKYLSRVGKKNGFNRKDLLKAVHYVILALYVHDRDERDIKETQSERRD